jgi:hypothetical protein
MRILNFLHHHWLSVILICGLLAAVAFVYHNREKFQ